MLLILMSVNLFAKESDSVFQQDGQIVISEIARKFDAFKAIGYKLPPGAFPMMMASWLFNTSEIDDKTMTITWQHDTKFFVSVGAFINKHVCQTKVGEQLCRVYFKKINGQASVLTSTTIAETIAKHMILAVSDDPKTLDAWSSNYIMWLFVNPQTITSEGLARRIVHEMFQAVDIKNTVSGVLEAAKDFSDTKLCGVAVGNINKSVRFASSAIRSYKIEDAIIGEILSRNSEGISIFSRRSCVDNLKWAHIQLETLYAKLNKENFINQAYKLPSQCFDQNMRDAINEKSGMAFGQYHFGKSEEQCDFITTPDLDQIEKLDLEFDAIDIWFHGPRPRVGGV